MTQSSTQPTKLSLETTSLSETRLEDLKTLFPEAFVEGQLNIEALVSVLGLQDDEFIETKRESFGLHWVGKEEAKRQAKKGTQWTLMPCPEETESLNWDTTQNLVIEADNLVALKLLVKSYAGKVDMIYIDPPYNCKADTLYNDDYSEDQSIYKKRAGLVDDDGNQLSTIKNKGHEHSLWLSMMYPRLQLMKRLLKSGGVIFISIDDAEVAHLRTLMDEVFGEENFVTTLIYEKKSSAKGVPPVSMVANTHEYIHCYSVGDFKFIGNLRSSESFANPDNDTRGPWRNTNCKSTVKDSSGKFTIYDPDTQIAYTDTWAFSLDSMNRMIEEKRLIFPKNSSGQVRMKEYLHEFKNENTPIKSLLGLYDAQANTQMLNSLIGDKVFQNTKSLTLISDLIRYTVPSDALILDCFTGSGTTAHAVMKLNAEDEGNRQFIMVQIPEKLDPLTKNQVSGYQFCESINKPQNIAEITKERLRRASSKIQKENPEYKGDLGFRVFKQVPSQYLQLDPINQPANLTDESLEEITNAHLLQQANPRLKTDINLYHLAYEVMLKHTNLSLTTNIKSIEFAGHSDCYVFDEHHHHLCIFSPKLDLDAVVDALDKLIESEQFPTHIYLLESSFADSGHLHDTINSLDQLSRFNNLHFSGNHLPKIHWFLV